MVRHQPGQAVRWWWASLSKRRQGSSEGLGWHSFGNIGLWEVLCAFHPGF